MLIELIKSYILHLRVKKLDKETKDYIKDYLDSDPEVKAMWKEMGRNVD